MADEVPGRVRKAADYLDGYAGAGERTGRLPQTALAQVAATGAVCLAPEKSGGYQSHPCDFLESAMAVPSGSGLGGCFTSFRLADALAAGPVAGRRGDAATNGSS
jgi:hypothetical protein